ncbi:hypothetical protein RGUI_3795 [Rhodovulum sp. P5]|uniref:hypothetical protein n=1 Tax=Rhodovulum sp. P5 TaxID=1564506 RepID=UPI0009C2FADE|nr:hypothetical protein [Rhodovulum sp. P5]ARE41936.1 hypothetical protein RGUI_3795 [Rhodovulum sp. P5]
MSQRPVTPVENYTRAFVVTGFFAIFAGLFCIWALWGYAWALGVAAAIWLLLRLAASVT